MDGRNAVGHRVSLLNDDRCELNTKAEQLMHPSRLRIPQLSAHPSTYSSTSTPVMSRGNTPQLIRSESTDSGPGNTPSPVTPNFSTYAFLLNPRRVGSPYSASSTTSSGAVPSKEVYAAYPPLPATQRLQYPCPPTLTRPALARSSSSARTVKSSSSSSSSSLQLPSGAHKSSTGKKNSYPCPLAKQLGCSDLFTTSGHAARHAKKHTGRKDALCPECNKAFTRKDNMEQHRRTHQTGRNSSRTGGSVRAKSRIRQQQQQQLKEQQQKKQEQRAASSATGTTDSIGAQGDGGTPTDPKRTPNELENGGYVAGLSARPVEMLKRGESASLAPGLETLAIVATGHA